MHLSTKTGVSLALLALLGAATWMHVEASTGGDGVSAQQHARQRRSAALPTVKGSDLVRKAAGSDKKIVGYFTDWTTRDMPADSIPFDKLTHINYAFALLEEGTYKPVIQTDSLLKDVVGKAHAKGVKVAVSIGGWTGSRTFSTMAASEQGRKSFVDGTVAFAKQYELDGVDIDWEFPGRHGMVCNEVSKDDADNFLTLLNELRKALPREKYISLAVRVQPFDGPNGPLSDVSKFAEPVDFIAVMAYDINGSWGATTGPNAPFNKAAGGDPFSFTQAADAWTGAGFPREKVLMGLAFYGRSATTPEVTSQGVTSMFMHQEKAVPKGDRDDAPWSEPCAGSPSAMSGVWKWKNLREEGVLTSADSASGDWERNWDDGSKTPWLVNKKSGQFVSYDDPESIKVKTDYVRCNGLGGVMIWALNQDNGELLDATNSALSGGSC